MEHLRSVLCVLLLVILGFVSKGEGFKQEFWLYNDEARYSLHFEKGMADTSELSSILPKINRVCATGMWDHYPDINFRGDHSFFVGSYTSSNVSCKSIDATTLRSFRHWAAKETTVDAISLYTNSYYSGEETLITARARTCITSPVRSLTATGTSDWMMFEGQHLDGQFQCLQVPTTNQIFGYLSPGLTLRTIGSIFKGCDFQEIRSYKAQQAL